ncbi:DMT family transporter [Cellulomonas sp. PSBB021]|uniref:DMT family transporter n=1 Tax=Cellulomonas sp. PSBB021 TaxID=2003551 RepID=UPI000B8DA9E2|nr:DMT family transporter [Cellulomonas sp. PSBB021]ASR55727.1 EamA family transporter [Cellulomonas sp. PSBB021]
MGDDGGVIESARGLRNVGVQAALLAAVLFGASAPLAKILLGEVSPWLLAGLLYVGAGVGMWIWRLVRRAPQVRLPRHEVPWLVGAVAAGGVAGPVLLMFGLSSMPASGASLLLNAEGVLTAVIAWVVFREPADRRVVLGMLAIVTGAVLIAVPTGQADVSSVWPAVAIIGACACWALDNNLTRKVSLTDASWLAMVKGGVAGPTNLVVALLLGAQLPAVTTTAAALALGFVSYGLSLVLFIVGLRHVGTARAGAYFSLAPFFGALLAVALGDTVTWQLLIAGALMAVGTWLHLSEQHGHEHTHHAVTHEHWHTHDDGHHDHQHSPGELVSAGVRHRHVHTHEPVTHTHEHYPDAHHRHDH